jgi:hypothetical protein
MTKEETIRNFLNKARYYKVLPALIKNSPCDHNAKVCVKAGYVKLTATSKTGNTYVITARGIKFILENLQPEKPKIFKLIKM